MSGPKKTPSKTKKTVSASAKRSVNDGRSPTIKSILEKKFPRTGGMHPKDYRVMKQMRELNGKSSVKTVPLETTKVKQKMFYESREETSPKEPIIKRLMLEVFHTKRKSHSSHKSKVTLATKHQNSIVKTAHHQAKDAEFLADTKEKTAETKYGYDREQQKRDYELKKVAKIKT